MPPTDRRDSRLTRLAGQIRGWLRVLPGPTTDPERSRPRVEVTPPSPSPMTLGDLFASLSEDIAAVLENDPAARHALEVVLVYPGLHAIWLHRIAHRLWKQGYVLPPRLLAHVNRMVTGIEIHPAARLGRRVFIDHGMGIVIGETATVGDDCLLYKGVLLGGTSLERAERHPTLGKGVVVGTNACILGPIQVGDGARVGSNSVVIRDVPERTSVVGVPGKIIQERRRTQQALDHGNLPDPVANVLQAMVEELEHLRLRIAELEGRPDRRRAGRDLETSRFETADEPPAGEA